MAFHKTNRGIFGATLTSDINGFVPTENTGAWDLTYDHGTEQTHDENGNLTDYGDWWETERFPEIKTAAIKAAGTAGTRCNDWQSTTHR